MVCLRLPRAARARYGKGASHGLRKSSWKGSKVVLPELRQTDVHGVCAEDAERTYSLRTVPVDGSAGSEPGVLAGGAGICDECPGSAESFGGSGTRVDPGRGRDVQ